MNILLVERDVELASLMAFVLEQGGHDRSLAMTGAGAAASSSSKSGPGAARHCGRIPTAGDLSRAARRAPSCPSSC